MELGRVWLWARSSLRATLFLPVKVVAVIKMRSTLLHAQQRLSLVVKRQTFDRWCEVELVGGERGGWALPKLFLHSRKQRNIQRSAEKKKGMNRERNR